MQSALFHIFVNVLLKCSRHSVYSGEFTSNITTSDSIDHEGAIHTPLALTHKARGIIDISQMTLTDIPFAVEEKLRKTKGVFSVQINAFSKKLAIEFDPSIISLDEIVKKISRTQ